MKRAAVLVGSVPLATLLVAGAAVAAPGAAQGPSSSQGPYLVRTSAGVVTESILTTGDAVAGYRMAGIPDGLGAFDNGDGTFTVLMHHEIPATLGVARDHGAKGAFVSKWVVDEETLEVLHGDDLIKTVSHQVGGQWEQVPAGDPALTIGRLCSADLPAVAAFFDVASGLGTQQRIFLGGEETGAEGRAFGTVVTGAGAGNAYELAGLGKFSWENAVAKPGVGTKTVVVGLDDSGGGQVYLYVGDKKATGNDVERAGLTGGQLYGLTIDGVAAAGPGAEGDATTVPPGGARFGLVPLGDVSGLTGAQQQANSVAAGVSALNRPEDGSWDPSDPANFYFATTASFDGISRLWKLEFDDSANVLAGGTATIEVASPPVAQGGPRMLDNLTVNQRGQVIFVEDVGGNNYLGGVYQYDPSNRALARIAQHDSVRFLPGGSGFLTNNEEASGVIPAPFLGSGTYLIDVQNHASSPDPELVEGGQLLVLRIPPGKPTS